MRVDGPQSAPANLQPERVSKPSSSAPPSRPSSVDSAQDQARLSLDGKKLAALKATLAQLPEVRQDRVNALRQAVAKGNYGVSDQQLSDAIASDLGQ